MQYDNIQFVFARDGYGGYGGGEVFFLFVSKIIKCILFCIVYTMNGPAATQITVILYIIVIIRFATYTPVVF